jgi:hypothetical protein
MRYRQNDQRRPSKGIRVIDSPGGIIYDSSSSTLLKAAGTFTSILDQPTRGFAERRKRGEVIMSPVTLVREKRQSSSESHFIGPQGYWGSREISGDLAVELAVVPVLPDYLQNDINLAKAYTLTKCYSEAAEPDWQSTVFAQELGKTIQMIRRPLKGSLDLIAKYKRTVNASLKYKGKRLTSTEAQLGAWANAHLEYRYGWKPLMQDIGDAIKAMTTAVNAAGSAGLRSRHVTRDGWRGNASGRGDVTANVCPGYQASTVHYEHLFTVRVDSGLIYDIVEPSKGEAIRYALGLTLDQVPSHAWEVVPFSFVVDWFVNVGDFLNASRLRPGFVFGGDWTTQSVRSNCVSKITRLFIQVVTDVVGNYTHTGGEYKEDILTTTRIVNSGAPSWPTPLPGALSANQMLDGASLIVGQLLGVIPPGIRGKTLSPRK